MGLAPRHTARAPLRTELLERLRDITYRRLRALRLRDIPSVLRFVDRVGFASLFRARGSDLPSVWGAIVGRRHPVLPRHTHHDEGVGLAWEAKDVLAVRKRLFYGKLLRRQPTFVALDLFPAFYALSGNRGEDGDYLRWARAGLLGRSARAIIEALIANPPLATADLRLLSGHAGAGKRYGFDRAMAELQEKLLAVKYAELYDPKFTFIWGPLHRWLPEPIATAKGLDPERAREAILERHLEVKWAAGVGEIERLFGWPRPATRAALAALAGSGRAEARESDSGRGTLWAVPGIDRALARL